VARQTCLLASALIALAATQPAQAATVEARPEPFATHVSPVVLVTAAAGERNQLVVTLSDAVRVADAAPLEAGDGCRKEADGRVACDLTTPGQPYVFVDAGDQDDEVRFDIGSRGMSIWLDGGDGNDLLIGGGMGENIFTGGNGDDRMVGGAGRNEFVEGAVANGSDRFEGRGRYGSTVRYDARRSGVRVELDGKANDGEPGEDDFISPSLGVYGGRGPDVLIGNERSNALVGGPRPDVLRGRGGNDALHGGTTLWGPVGSDERLYGGAGADRITGGAGNDLLVGGSGNDDLQAFSGADRLLLGPGRDIARAGPEDDVIHAGDGSVDAVNCGLGMDRLRNDPRDYVVSAMCDHHDRSRRLGSVFDFRP
jgi:hypothetical protein